MVAPETARAPSLPRTRAEMKIVESRVVCGVWKTAGLNHVHAFQPFPCSRGVCNRDLFDGSLSIVGEGNGIFVLS